jgi:class 3 adenylate cyclase
MKKNLRHLLNKISVAVLFVACFVYAIQHFYTEALRTRQLAYSRERTKFVLSMTDERVSALANAGASGEVSALVADTVRSVVEYFDAEELGKILVFERASGRVIFPVSSAAAGAGAEAGTAAADVGADLLSKIKDRLEGEVELDDRFGYFATLGASGLSFFVYSDKSDLFVFQNKTLYLVSGLLVLFCVVIFLMDARTQGRLRGLLKRLVSRFDQGFSGRVSLLERIEERLGRENEPVVESYNEMALRAGNLVRRLEGTIRALGTQRNNLKKLIVVYRKYAPSENLVNVSEGSIGELVSRRQDVSSLTLELVDFLDPIEGVYPEAIAKELGDFHEHLKSGAIATGGIVNFSHGYFVNLVYGVPNPDPGSFRGAIECARKAFEWVRERNGSAGNLSGVKWNLKMGLSHGKAMTGVVGESYMVLGKVIEESGKMLEHAKVFGVPLVTNYSEGLYPGGSGNSGGSAPGGARSRKLDLVGRAGREMGYIYEIFLQEHEGVEDAIKLYYHGLDMFFEGKYEIACLDFKKVNQIFGTDNPSLIFLQRCEKLARKFSSA